MKRFCPTCGNEVVRGTFCAACKKPDFVFADIKSSLCVTCRRLLFHNKWFLPKTLEDGLATVAEKSIRARVKVGDVVAPDVPGPGATLKFSVPIAYQGDAFELPGILTTTICDRCSKQGTKYFEAILQIRPGRQDVVGFVLRDIEKQKEKGVFLNKEEVASSGVNLYITNQTYAKVLARKLKEQFGARVHFNETLFSMNRQTSRDVFRLTILVELPTTSKTDMIVVNLKRYQVTSISKAVSVIDLETGQKTSLPRSDTVKEKQVVVPSVLAEIALVHPRLEVLHPETYASVPVENANRMIATPAIGEKIRVAFDADGRAWAFLQ